MTDKEKNPKDMWTSVSAITDADDCLRRWWFHKRCKLPQDQRQATIFGDVHHAVCARFLEADDRGIDKKTGRLVELYPEGWRVMHNRFDEDKVLYKVSDSEAALIKVLVQKAITDGVLVREPGRTVEREFETVIFTKGYAKVVLVGFVDLDTPRGLEDHKTTKDKKYLLSKAKIKKSIQMMGYGYERYLTGHNGNIWLCHNGYVKDFDSPIVRKTDVEVTQIEVMDFFANTILPIVKRMFKYYSEYPPSRLSKWRDLSGPANADKSCNHHYGGPCPYVMICGGLCTFDDYLRKYGMTVTDITGKTENIEKGKPMANSLMNKIKAEQAAQATAGGTTQPVASPTEVAAATEVQEQSTAPAPVGGLSAMLAKVQAGAKSIFGGGAAAKPAETVEQAASATEGPNIVISSLTHDVSPVITEKQTAPWYSFNANEAECPACKDGDVLGFNTKMEPCMICVCKARAQGKLCPEDYDVDVNDDGSLRFTPKAGGEATTTQVASEPEVKTVIQPVVEKPVVAPISIADTVKQVAAQSAGPVVSMPDWTAGVGATASATEIVGKAEFQPQFDMLVGCSYAKTYPGDVEVIYIDILVDVMLQEISETAGKHWTAIDHFVLMQAIDAYVPSLMPHIKGQTVISTIPSKGSAHARLVDGLKLYARSIIYPFGG